MLLRAMDLLARLAVSAVLMAAGLSLAWRAMRDIGLAPAWADAAIWLGCWLWLAWTDVRRWRQDWQEA